VVAAVLVLGLAGCGDEGRSDEGPASVDATDGRVALTGRDDLTWDVTAISAPAGTLTIELTCEPEVNHNVVVEELDVEVAACTPGRTQSGEVELEAGVYTYICAVPGHERTMRGQLTVR
jgi:plastocyanin